MSRWEHQLVAFMCSRNEVIAYCTANLARYKVPSRIHLVQEIPRLGVGKIDRKTVREMLTKAAAESQNRG